MSHLPETNAADSLDQVLADILKAADAGKSPDTGEWLARHPQWRMELEEFFSAQENIVRWTRPLQELCAAPSTLHEQATLGAGSSLPAAPGTGMLGDYELLAEIARGGMGVVYRARQKRLNRVVALKMILAGNLATATDVQRLRSEAEAAARLDHPHIVPIYEVGEHQGQHFFTMKLIEGENLANLVVRDRPSIFGAKEQRETAMLVAKVAGAVHYAHQHGILHRDLKPANILLDDKGEPHVSDFGLAKRVGGEQRDDVTQAPALTQTGAIVGTPSYMAPEQASGTQALTTAADTYSLGAILYEMLTGRPPFRGTSALDTALQVIETDAPRPRSFNPHIAYDLETICLKCLEKDPNKRYPSAEALAEDLRHWLADEPIQGRRTSRWERTIKWARRNRLASSMAVLTTAAAVGLLLLAGFLWHNAELRAEAVQDLGEAQDALREAKNEQGAAKADVERLQKEADAEKDNLKKLQLLAELERAKAMEARIQADQVVYAADMQFAHAAATTADLPRLVRLLELHRPAAGKNDLRGFEWHYLWRLANRDRYTLKVAAPKTGSETAVFVAVSPDGKTLASLGGDDKLQLWDFASGKQRSAMDAPKNVVAIAFTEAGDKVQAISIGGDGKMKMPAAKDLDPATNPPTLDKLTARLVTHTLDPDSKKTQIDKTDLTRLASPISFMANPVGLMATMTGAMMPFSEGLVSPVSLALSHDRKTLAIGGIVTINKLAGNVPGIRQEGVIVLWDVVKGRPRAFLKGHDSMVVSVAFAPDGSLASTGFDKMIKLWSADGRERLALTGNRAVAMTVRFSADGKRLVAGGSDGVVLVWEAATGKLVYSLMGHREPVPSVAPVGDGQFVATASVDGAVKVWDLSAQASPTIQFPGAVDNISFAADGKRLFAIAQNGALMTLDAATGKELGKPPSPDGFTVIKFSAVSPDGAMMAYHNLAKSVVTIRDTATGKELHAQPLKGFNYTIQFAPDGKSFAYGTGFLNKSGTVAVVRVDTGKEVFRLAEFTHKVSCLAFSGDGKYLSAGSADRSVAIIDTTTGQVLHRIKLAHPVEAVAFAPDGKTLAVSVKASIRIHETGNGNLVREFPTYSHSAVEMVFGPDGKRLATGGGSFEAARGTGVKLWDVATGRETISLGDASAVIRSLTFSPDGTRLAAASSEDSIINNFGTQGNKSLVQNWETK